MKRILSAIVLCSLSLALYAQGGIDGVLAAIEKNNTTLSALRSTLDAQKLENHTGLTLPDPEVEFGYLWGGPSEIGKKKDVSASQSFDFATLSGAKKRLARQQDQLADCQYRTDRMSILLEAQQICLDIVYYNALIKELNIRLNTSREIEYAQKRRLDSGDITRMDYNNVALDLATILAEKNRNESERDAFLADLQRLNGGIPISLSDTEFPILSVPDNFDSWYAEAEKKSPMLSYVKQEIEVAKRQVALSKADGMPTFSLGFAGEYVVGERFQGATIGLSIPLWGNKNRVRQAKAEVTAAKARQEDAHRQFYGTLQSLFNRQKGLWNTVETFSAALSSTDNTILLKKALDAGSISTVDYLLGSRLYYDVINQRLDALRSWHKIWAEMNAYAL